MLKEAVVKYYQSHHVNCAQAMLAAANEVYDLHLDPGYFNALGVFGGGISSGSICGAIATGAAVIGLIYGGPEGNGSPLAKAKSAQYFRLAKQALGGELCKNIKPVHASPEARCLETVTIAAQALEQVLSAES